MDTLNIQPHYSIRLYCCGAACMTRKWIHPPPHWEPHGKRSCFTKDKYGPKDQRFRLSLIRYNSFTSPFSGFSISLSGRNANG